MNRTSNNEGVTQTEGTDTSAGYVNITITSSVPPSTSQPDSLYEQV